MIYLTGRVIFFFFNLDGPTFLEIFFLGGGEGSLFLLPQVFFLFFFFLMCVYSTPFGSKILVLKCVVVFFRD